MSAITEFAEKYEKQIRGWLDEKTKVREMLKDAGAPVPKPAATSFENKVGSLIEYEGLGIPYTQGTLYADRRDFYLGDQFQAPYGLDVRHPLHTSHISDAELKRLRQEKMAEYIQRQSAAVFGTAYEVRYVAVDQDETTQDILDNILTIPTDQAIESMRQTIEKM